MKQDLWPAAKAGDEAARAEIINAHRYLVPHTRRRALSKAPERFHDDLEAAGYVGLVKAVDSYDPAKGIGFKTWAILKIRGEMHEELRREDWAPRSVRDKEKQGLPARTWELISLDSIRDDTEGIQLLESITDPVEEPGLAVPRRLDQAVIQLLVRSLPRRERKVIELHYWEEEPFWQIGQRMGISNSRADQLHTSALMLLRCCLSHAQPSP
ncbi:MAG TPA: sigma-70 family RNA polymerase sigma factor [Gemmatimonadales bacterium]